MEDAILTKQPRRTMLQFGLRHVALLVAVVAIALCYFKIPAVSGARPTNRELDVAIVGRGYFEVVDEDSGDFYYTRYGRLSINAQGELAVGRATDGWVVMPRITIPPDWTSLRIDKHGGCSITLGGYTDEAQIGSIQLATFTSDEGLREVVPNIYAETEASGTPNVGNPGTDEFGFLQQRWLEAPSLISALGPQALIVAAVIVVAYLLTEMRRLNKRLDRIATLLEGQR